MFPEPFVSYTGPADHQLQSVTCLEDADWLPRIQVQLSLSLGLGPLLLWDVAAPADLLPCWGVVMLHKRSCMHAHMGGLNPSLIHCSHIYQVLYTTQGIVAWCRQRYSGSRASTARPLPTSCTVTAHRPSPSARASTSIESLCLWAAGADSDTALLAGCPSSTTKLICPSPLPLEAPERGCCRCNPLMHCSTVAGAVYWMIDFSILHECLDSQALAHLCLISGPLPPFWTCPAPRPAGPYEVSAHEHVHLLCCCAELGSACFMRSMRGLQHACSCA